MHLINGQPELRQKKPPEALRGELQPARSTAVSKQGFQNWPLVPLTMLKQKR